MQDDNKALDQLTSKEAVVLEAERLNELLIIWHWQTCKGKPRSDETESGMPGCLWSFSFVIPIGAYSPVSCHYQDFHVSILTLSEARGKHNAQTRQEVAKLKN